MYIPTPELKNMIKINILEGLKFQMDRQALEIKCTYHLSNCQTNFDSSRSDQDTMVSNYFCRFQC